MEDPGRGEYRRDAPDLGGTNLLGQPATASAMWDVMERARLGLGARPPSERSSPTRRPRPRLAERRVRRRARHRGVPAVRGLRRGALEQRAPDVPPPQPSGGHCWGEGRLIGNADFSPSGRWLDAARAPSRSRKRTSRPSRPSSRSRVRSAPGSATARARTRRAFSSYGLTGKWTIHPLLRVELFALARVARSSGDELDGSTFQLARAVGERYTGAAHLGRQQRLELRRRRRLSAPHRTQSASPAPTSPPGRPRRTSRRRSIGSS